MNEPETTIEILKRLAPDFYTLYDYAEKSSAGPWKMFNGGWTVESQPTFKFSVQLREGVFEKKDAHFIYEAKWSVKSLLEAHAALLLEKEQQSHVR